MKTPLQSRLTTIAPSISIVTLWEHDPDAQFSELTAPGCAFENEDPDDWTAWQSEIRATAIIGGEEITGSAYLGGTWEKYGDNPAVSNPEISGYENQMTQEALTELRGELEAMEDPFRHAGIERVKLEIANALEFLKAESQRAYDQQRAEIEIARLLEAPRCQSCTESSNVALTHAIDSASMKPSPESLIRLIREIEGDKEWNPHFWQPAASLTR